LRWEKIGTKTFDTDKGGKGNFLAKLASFKKIRWPETYSISLSSLAKWISSIEGYDCLVKVWRSPQQTWPLTGELEESAIFRHNLNKAKLPDCFFEDELFKKFPLIFRSSMSLEDSSESSFAGIFDSIVANNAFEMEAAFKKVILSAYKKENLFACLQAGVDPIKFTPGVIVQPYMTAEFSGVVFSRFPLNPTRARCYLEYIKGNAERLVSGKKSGITILENSPEFISLPDSLRVSFGRLFLTAHQLEERFNFPVDIEWLIAKGMLYIVQVRPIVSEEITLAYKLDGQRVWSRQVTLERYPDKMTLLGWSSLKEAMYLNLNTLRERLGIVVKSPEDVAIRFNGVIYSDPNFFNYPRGVQIAWGHFIVPSKLFFWKLVAQLFFSLFCVWSPKALVRRKLKILDLLLADVALDIENSWRQLVDKTTDKIGAIEQEIERVKKSSYSQIVALFSKMNSISEHLLKNDLLIYLIKDSYFKMLSSMARVYGVGMDRLMAVLSPYADNITMRLGTEYLELISLLKEDKSVDTFLEKLAISSDATMAQSAAKVLNQSVFDKWEQFLAAYGHNTTSWDLAVPTWKEQPSQLAPIILASLHGRNRAESLANNNNYAEELKNFLTLFPSHLQGQIREVIFRVKKFMELDDEQHFFSGKLISPSRALLFAAGDQLLKSAHIKDRNHIFHFTLEEFKHYLSLEDKYNISCFLEKRAREFARIDVDKAPFTLFSPRPQELTSQNLGKAFWKGTPVIAGEVEGIVHIVKTVADFETMPEGCIMVIDSPNPIFTVIYPRIKGILSASGGLLSHGFVSARQYNLVAITDLQGVTSKIKNGRKVRMNGYTGSVEMIDE